MRKPSLEPMTVPFLIVTVGGANFAAMAVPFCVATVEAGAGAESEAAARSTMGLAMAATKRIIEKANSFIEKPKWMCSERMLIWVLMNMYTPSSFRTLAGGTGEMENLHLVKRTL